MTKENGMKQQESGPNTRAISLAVLEDILENNGYYHIVLKKTLLKYQSLKKQDRAFITRLVEGTIEHLITIDYMIDCYSKTKVKKMKPLIRNILRMSVYQLKYMTQIPSSAICNEAVKLVKKRGLSGLSGFVNGTLRTMVREPEKIVFPDAKKEPLRYMSVYYSMPEWIIEVFHTQYSWEVVERTLQAFLEVGKTSIRCNTNKISVTELEQMLLDENVTFEPGQYSNDSFLISNYNYLNDLNSFQKGYFVVQDEASMLVARCAGIKKDDFIIDVCAAPGGKSLHAASILKDLFSDVDLEKKTGIVISRDLSENKVALIFENKNRLEQDNLIPQVFDATKLDEDNIGKADVVIADLPCSGLGVIGKKPDIKYKVKKDSLTELALLQRQILDVVHQYVKPNGILMYSTCTMNVAENEENMNYIKNNLGYELESLNPYLDEKLYNEDTEKGYLKMVPGIHGTDGFFIARFRRKA